jgi:hypothetical protein
MCNKKIITMRKLIINPNFKVEIYKGLAKSKNLKHVYKTDGNLLIVHMEDLEEVTKIMKKLVLKFKLK